MSGRQRNSLEVLVILGVPLQQPLEPVLEPPWEKIGRIDLLLVVAPTCLPWFVVIPLHHLARCRAGAFCSPSGMPLPDMKKAASFDRCSPVDAANAAPARKAITSPRWQRAGWCP